ncbi:MAG: hypothetical protein ACLFTZ_03895 [Acholeplasmataceae bacterium]
MVEFARYYIRFLGELFANTGEFFRRIFDAFADFLFNDFIRYITDFINASNAFNVFDWIMAIVVTMINIAFVVFLILRLGQFLRRYLKFIKREIEKDDLMEEIALLNMRTAELVEEKNKILSLKMSDLGLIPDEAKRELFGQSEEEEAVQSRFVKLIAVDQKYQNQITSVRMSPDDMINLRDLVQRFINFSASQLRLFYDERTVSAFFAGLATSKLMILEGISGTGKTSLPYAMGKFFQNEAAIIPVQPSWRDRAEMLGYLNEFTKRFNETDFLKAIYETTYREDINIIVLDEMNLARVEYYFAEFLSLMEMPDPAEWKVDVVPDSAPGDPKNIRHGKILLPQNVWFVGTANKDDSTFTITDKVYDRATALVMNVKADYIDAPRTNPVTMSHEYLNNLFGEAQHENRISTKTLDNLVKLDQFIAKNFKITFGNRIMKQIHTFVPVFVACGGTEIEGLDYMVTHKILRKFESLNLPFLRDELKDLIKTIERLFGKGTFKESIAFINVLLNQI